MSNEWYKDRDFPEVKASNADIIAVIENPQQLERVIREYNQLLELANHNWSSAESWKSLCLEQKEHIEDLEFERDLLQDTLRDISLGCPDQFLLSEKVEAGYLMNLAREALNEKT